MVSEGPPLEEESKEEEVSPSLPADQADDLIGAARYGDEANCLDLLHWGADINFTDAVEGKTPLHWAATCGLKTLCKELLKKGAAVDSLDRFGDSSLHHAAIRGQSAMCRLLVEGGADLEIEDALGMSPLLRAAMLVDGGHDILSRELQRPVDVPILDSILEACKVLLELGAQTTMMTSMGSALSYIARTCKEFGDYVESSTEQVCRVLLDGGAPVDHPSEAGRTALHFAVDGDHAAVCRLLLDKGADINYKDDGGFTPLLTASTLCREEIIKLLVERGANVNHVNNKGVCALHVAADNGQEDICKLFLDAGADVKIATRDEGSLPIHLAACGGHTEVIKMLLERGSPLDDPNSQGVTALFLAASGGSASTCKFLIQSGAAVDMFCPVNGDPCATVIIGAYGKGGGRVCAEGLEVVNIFLDHGVDYKTVFDLAVLRNEGELLKTLVLHPSFDPTVVPNGVLLRDLICDLAEWQSMPNKLQEALVSFSGAMVDLEREAKGSKEGRNGEGEVKEPDSKKRKM